MRVVIIGAGISGLSLAAMLRRINIPSVVLEAAPNFEAVFQPPIVLWSNALSCMRAFGLDDVFSTTAATDPLVSADPFQFLRPVMAEGGDQEATAAWSNFCDKLELEVPPEDFFGIRQAGSGRWLLKQHNQLVQLPPMDEIDNIPNSNAPTATSNSVVSQTILHAHKTQLANVPLRVTLPSQTVKRSLMSHCNEVRFGRSVRRIEPSLGPKGGAIVHLDNGEADWADVVVGADGLHSTVRRLIYTAENQSTDLQSHNMLQVDGFARREAFSPYLGVNPCEFWGSGRVFSYYPHIASSASNTLTAAAAAAAKSETKQDGADSNGGGKPSNILSFCATIFNAPKEVSTLGQDINEMQPALRELMCREFQPFGEEITSIFRDAALLRPAELLKVPIMPAWHHRRAVLIGDAAHGTYPSYLQQDASLAVEDAAVLATILATLPLRNDRGFEYGFRKYEKARRYRVEQYHRQSQQVRDFAARSSMVGARDALLTATPGFAANRLLNWMSSWSYRGSEAEFDIEGAENIGR